MDLINYHTGKLNINPAVGVLLPNFGQLIGVGEKSKLLDGVSLSDPFFFFWMRKRLLR